MKAKYVKNILNEDKFEYFKPKSEAEIIEKLKNLSQEEKDEKLKEYLFKYRDDNKFLNYIDLLIKAGANFDNIDICVWPILVNVIVDKDYKLVKFLIDNGANVNIRTPEGNTPLAFALGSDIPDKNIIELLIKNGAKLVIKKSMVKNKDKIFRNYNKYIK